VSASAFNRWFGKGWLAMGFAFLYLPIIALVVFSFNDSPVPNSWRGFTLKWYAALANDSEMIAAFWLSMKIAFFTACASVILGTLAAFALVKYRRFKGRTLFSPLLQQMCAVGEAAGTLEQLLEKAAEFQESELSERLEQLTRLIEPATIVVMGLLVGGLVLALYLPVFQMGQIV
jgi:putrescine transport system permease protein